MTLRSKMEIRSFTIKTLLLFKNNPSIENIKKGIKELKKIEDKEVLLSLLIKEITGKDKSYDNILKIVIINIFGQNSEKALNDELLNDKNSDSKKFFIIDVLRDLNSNVNYNNIENHIKNSKELSNKETLVFLQDTQRSIEKQIDFLDFLYSINQKDKKLLLKSVVEDYKEEELSNILSLALYVVEDKENIKYILNNLIKIKSDYSKEGIQYILKNSNDKEILEIAHKAENKLKLPKKFKKEIYKELLKSKFYEANVSLLDLEGNFVISYAREQDNKITVFYTALNLIKGAIAGFGFENLNKENYEKIKDKIFKETKSIKIEDSLASEIINDAIQNGEEEAPYELLCWRKLTYDAPPYKKSKFDFKKNKLNEFDYKRLIKKDYFKNWFIKEEDNQEFKKLISQIKKLKTKNHSSIDKLIKENIKLIFDNMVHFRPTIFTEARFLYLGGMKKEAEILYNIIKDEKYLADFEEKIIHKSIYEYFSENEIEENKILTKDFLGIIKKWQKEF